MTEDFCVHLIGVPANRAMAEKLLPGSELIMHLKAALEAQGMIIEVEDLPRGIKLGNGRHQEIVGACGGGP